MLAGAVAWLTLPAVSVAPNRIVQGTPQRAAEALGWGVTLLASVPMLAVAVLAWRPTPRRLPAALALVIAVLVAIPLWLSAVAVSLEPSSRLGIGSAIWCVLFVSLLALIELRVRLALSRPFGWAVLVPVALAWWGCLAQWLAPLALYREYQGRSDQFYAAFLQHLVLVGAAVGAAILLGAGLALAMRRRAGLRRVGFGILNFLQTIPSIALFGLLLAPLAWLSARFEWLAALGVSGIGWAPAWLALLGYSLLPMVRNIFVALDEVDPAVIESARGMGMSRRQVFLQVRLPLALPVVLEGVRITTVQAIGLTAVAALIGAGGFGTFVFQGLGQAAMDLVLLGALPIIALALIADALLSALTDYLRQGGTT
ncbi:ABC transporter permease [Billgrantia gudaonensis]|uniref:Osmoprotectant transport system permease protein n=1 Tax=Billgrantia gudaonensis TaxID=376427 RepID=A0A1G8WU97_9GAMM|nr:ABC transporter permease [Halomonas gudaonensis]SDJ81170.1 osmoprotectant transport system permease protein [Halomonas gudaonensis]